MRLDDLARFPSTSGFTLVHAEASLLDPLARHLARRARAAGRTVLCIDGVELDEPWRELAGALGVAVWDDPFALACALLERAEGSCVLVCAPRSTSWGVAVADEIARIANDGSHSSWFVELCEARRCPSVEPLVLPARVAPDHRRRWWEALWQEQRGSARLATLDRMDDLERWWLGARDASDVDGRKASSEAQRLLARLASCRCRVSPTMRQQLGSDAAFAELQRGGFISRDGDGCVRARLAPIAATAEDAVAAARCLEAAGDSWGRLRAAVLLLSADRWDHAADLAEQVLGNVDESCGRADLWCRWQDALERMATGPMATATLLRFSALALELGDVEPAFALAERATAVANDPEAFEVRLCLGRATAARGDHRAAAQALDGALQRAPSEAERARALVELADTSSALGDRDRAKALAEAACAGEHEPATGLAARNVLGKLLLAAGAWQEAADHFAADSCSATQQREPEAQLRAELNRGTALLMGARYGEARARFEAVLDGAEQRSALRAKAFAASNLAVLARYQHDYAAALRWRERAVRAFRRIGNRRWLARCVTYLCDLRVDLGLIDEASQGLAFARRVIGSALQPTDAAWMGYVASRVHFARGDTAAAAAAIVDACASTARSSDGNMITECCCQAARVALAQGDAARAETHLARAAAASETPGKAAELALLEAQLARSAGEAFDHSAQHALQLAHSTGDRLRSAEAQLLLHHAARADGDTEVARRHMNGVREIHDSIAASLPEQLAERYRDFVQRTVLSPGAASSPAPAPRTVSPAGRSQLLGSHPTMAQLRHHIDKVAVTSTTVLIRGESGTGKELVADGLHARSQRRAGPLVKVNCAALVDTLLLSELFGHEKGAFTGAAQQHRGCFEHADGGTIFLDEIGDLAAGTQAALLRVLQDRTFHRVGGTELVCVDVRVVCATHRDLRAMVESGSFREDLFYRLREVELLVPPLRQRLEDLPLLCAELLLRIAKEQEQPLKRLSADALELLSHHGWPGNVRELQNALRAAALFAEADTVTAAELRRHASGLRSAQTPERRAEQPADATPDPTGDQIYAAVRSGTGLRELQKQLEHHCICRALRETDGHITRAAALLGIKRPRLSQLIKEHKLRDDSGEQR